MRITRSQNIVIGFAAIGLVAVLGACGGTTISTSGGGSGSAGGGVSVWKKGNTTIQLTVLTQDGKVIVNETAIVGSG